MEPSLLARVPSAPSDAFPTTDNRAEEHCSFVKSWGCELLAVGQARFRLWAPNEEKVGLRLGELDLPMTPVGEGWFEVSVTNVDPAMEYAFILGDGLLVPDPAARAQSDDQHGPSVITNPTAYRWTCGDWRGRPWHEAVLYELHIGTFTPEGTFEAAAARLPELARLGITAVEIMPVAHFPGDRNWGYDGVFLYAPHRHYGSPDALKAFIDAAHKYGMMVFLDVVYNHFGPDGNYLQRYAPQFFRKDKHTPWGVAIDYTQAPVRQFFVDNALYWLGEFNFDGLRLDAIDNIEDDDSDEHMLMELATRVRETFPNRHIHLVTEDVRNITYLHERDVGGHVVHFDAEWNDDFHHVAHVIATGESGGYYRDFVDEPWRKLARALAEGYIYQGEVPKSGVGLPVGEPSAHLPPVAFVNFIQNHDQIGNRAFGERLTVLAEPEMVELLTTLLLLAPQIPLLYMGEEYGETNPFYFFSDLDGSLGDSVREGRKGEAEKFGGFPGGKTSADLPDPLAPDTVAASRLDWAKRETPAGRARLDMVRELLALRRRHIIPLLKDIGGNTGQIIEADNGVIAVDWMLNGKRLELRANFATTQQPVPGLRGQIFHASPSQADRAFSREGELPPQSILYALG